MPSPDFCSATHERRFEVFSELAKARAEFAVDRLALVGNAG
jgi:hypothetical protein